MDFLQILSLCVSRFTWNPQVCCYKAGIGLLLFLTVNHVALQAQTASSTITGRILDATGAVVPDAEVQVKNEGTGIVSKGTSSNDGLYTVPLLPTGRFTITAVKSGFKTFVDQNVFLAPGSVLHYTISLQLGAMETRIEVTSAAPVIQAETGELSALQTQKLFKYNPQPNYTLCSPNAQAMLTPGSSQRAYMSFHGVRPFQTKLQINGLDIAQYGSPFAAGSQEGIEVTKTYDILAPAEYAQPVTVDSTTRSGTNEFHGSAGVNMENLALNAVGPFTFRRPAGRPFTTTILNGGGPIFIPKVYDGRGRSFWFYSFNTRTRFGALPVTQNVPTDNMRAGDYTGVVSILRNPFTGQNFPTLQIPSSLINPTALKIQNLVYKRPDVVTLNGVQNITNFAAFNEQKRHQTQLTGDHKLTERHKLMVTWLEGGQFRPRSPALCGPAQTLPGNLAGFLDNIDDSQVDIIQASLGSTISRSMFNEFRFSYNRLRNKPRVSRVGGVRQICR